MTGTWRTLRLRQRWGRMAVHRSGEGPPLLALHGLAGSGRYWAGLPAALGGSFDVIAPDLPGFGRSDKPAAADYSRSFHLDALDELLELLRIERPLVVGHSMGGVLAGLWAARHLKRARALAVVAAPFPHAQTAPYGPPAGGARLAGYLAAMRLWPLLAPVIAASRRDYPRAVVADYLRHTVDSYRRSAGALIWSPEAADELRPLGRLDAPALLLFSDSDATIASDSLARWRSVMPQAAVALSGGGHQLLLATRFRPLSQWLDDLEA